MRRPDCPDLPRTTANTSHVPTLHDRTRRFWTSCPIILTMSIMVPKCWRRKTSGHLEVSPKVQSCGTVFQPSSGILSLSQGSSLAESSCQCCSGATIRESKKSIQTTNSIAQPSLGVNTCSGNSSHTVTTHLMVGSHRAVAVLCVSAARQWLLIHLTLLYPNNYLAVTLHLYLFHCVFQHHQSCFPRRKTCAIEFELTVLTCFSISHFILFLLEYTGVL